MEEGEVTRVKSTTVELCDGGKIKLKMKADVAKPYKLACGGEWADSRLVMTEVVMA